jgi:hypothetical protein
LKRGAEIKAVPRASTQTFERNQLRSRRQEKYIGKRNSGERKRKKKGNMKMKPDGPGFIGSTTLVRSRD